MSSPYLEQALAITKKILGEQYPDTASSLISLGALLLAQKDHAAARPYYEQALDIYKKFLGEQHPDTATLLNNLGFLLNAQGDYAAARPYLEQALAISKKILGEQHPDTATSLSNLGFLLYAQGDHAAARAYFEQALAIRKKALSEQHPDTASSLNHLGMSLHSQGNHAAARPYYEQALAIQRKTLGEQHPDTAQSLNNLGTLLRAQEDHAAARPYLEQALAIYKKVLGKQHPDTATSLNNLGILLHSQGDLAAARPYYEQALAISKKILGEQHPDTARSLNNLGFLLQAQGDLAAARPSYEQALNIQRWALDFAADGLAERQQLAMGEKFRRYLDSLLAASAQDASHATADLDHLLAWKGAVSARQHRLRLLRQDPALAPLAGRLQALTARLANLASAAPVPKMADSHRAALVKLSQDKEDLEVEIARLSASFRKEQERARMTSIQLAALLPPDAALVDFLEYSHHRPDPAQKGNLLWEWRLTAFVLRRETPVVRVELGSVSKITDAVDAWRRAVMRRSPPTADDPGQILRQLVWLPLAKHLAGANTIFISPDGAVARVSFAALPGEAPGSYLLEEVNLAVIPLPRLLPALFDESPGQSLESLLLVGGIEYGAAAGKSEGERGPGTAARSGTRAYNFAPLKGTSGEIQALRDTFERRFKDGKVTLLREAEATEAALRKASPTHRWLHIATHGFFAPPEVKSAEAPVERKHGFDLFGKADVRGFHPGLLSGLALAGANRVPELGHDDGILTALEVTELDLRKTDLVVLSACETGLGKVAGGEGVLGLQRAFQIAGARTTVTTMWQVDDDATRRLMERFYDNLWGKKLGTLASLREAQLWMLHEGAKQGLVRGFERVDETVPPPSAANRTPPFYWAPFVLSGDWR